MNQMPVKWVDPDCLFQTRGLNTVVVPVIELTALREEIKKICDESITKMEASEQPSCSCYLDGLNNLLARLGEE